MTARRLHGVWLGRQPYEPVHRLQNELQEARKAGKGQDTVLFVEHEPVITLGRGAQAAHVLLSRERLHELGIDVVETQRGGDVTLHAPGQLVCYPILDLSPDRCDVRRYIRDLTEVMRRLALDFEIEGGTLNEFVGFWVDRASIQAWPGEPLAKDPCKLGAIGVHLSRWVTKHGFAFNLTTDLELYRWVVPCGISTHGVTSVEQLTGKVARPSDLAPRAFATLAQVFGAEAGGFEERLL
jgi:lipoyl(octanoyl) transferase